MGDFERFAITFGEVAILHVGGVEFGTKREHGFSVQELREVQRRVVDGGGDADLVMLSDALPERLRAENEAATLLIRNGAALMLGTRDSADRLLEEQRGVEYDRKFWNARQSTTMNKQARYNVVFGPEQIQHSTSYEQPTVHALATLPELAAVREALGAWLGSKARGLFAEGNHYYKPDSGIGFHGDAGGAAHSFPPPPPPSPPVLFTTPDARVSERKIVVCLSLGSTSTLRYQWRRPKESAPFGASVDLLVKHGDVYVMSEKATGHDWLSRSKHRVVHAAGCSKYIDKNSNPPQKSIRLFANATTADVQTEALESKQRKMKRGEWEALTAQMQAEEEDTDDESDRNTSPSSAPELRSKREPGQNRPQLATARVPP